MLFHGPPRLCHSILPHSLLSTGAMQKRIETFFVSQTVKKAKTGTIDQRREVCSSSARDDNEGWRVSEKDKIEETESIHLRKETEIEGGGDVKGDQIQKMQELRALGNRNDALAKQAVIRTERSGDLPMLGDLLVEPSWRDLLDKEMNKTYFKSLETFVRGEWNSHMIFPPKHAVFRAFNTCPVQEVRVVILGQDPYHDLGQAQGLSFSVPKGKQLPSSLRNIYKELNEDIGCPRGSHGCLEKWAHQGVLLLNAVLTVRAHNAASHAKRGWETFTSEAIARLSRERKGLVFLLWGKYAQEKGKVIDRNNGHHILTSAHPSGLSASRGFFGCRHFSKCNELLVSQGDLPIDWCIHD